MYLKSFWNMHGEGSMSPNNTDIYGYNELTLSLSMITDNI